MRRPKGLGPLVACKALIVNLPCDGRTTRDLAQQNAGFARCRRSRTQLPARDRILQKLMEWAAETRVEAPHASLQQAHSKLRDARLTLKISCGPSQARVTREVASALRFVMRLRI